MDLLKYALAYQKIGFFILPLIPGKKRPYEEWKDRRNKRPEPGEIERWWKRYPDAQIGMACGKYSGVDVIDFDGLDVRSKFEAIVCDLPETYSQVSGRVEIGEHILFKHNGHAFKNISKVKTEDGQTLDIDIRTTGGILVLAPSLHKSGKRYHWSDLNPLEMDNFSDELCDMPADAVAFFEKACSEAGSDGKNKEHFNVDSFLAGVAEGERDDHLFRYACSARARKLNYSEAKLIILEAAKNCQPPFDANLAIQKLDQGWKYEAGTTSESSEKIEILTGEELKQETLCLQIPDKILNTGGLIGDGLSYLDERGLPDVPQLNLASVLTVVANLIATKICYNKVYCNLFTLKIGRTSIGKSRADTELLSAITKASIADENLNNCFEYIDNFSSGAALYKILQSTPHVLCSIDEGTGLFRRYKALNPAQEDRKEALMTITSKAGQPLTKKYADSNKDIKLDNHCLTVLANATPVIFDSLQYEDFETGLFQRIDVWCYEGDTPKWGNEQNEGLKAKKFIEHMSNLAACGVGGAAAVGDALNLPYALEGTSRFLKLKKEWSEENRVESNKHSEDSIRGIILRRFDASIKFALVRAGATRAASDIYRPLDVTDLEWGICLTKCLSDWKQKQLLGRITTGEFDADIEYFKRAVSKTMQTKGRKPTIKYMMNRNKKMKNWGKKYFAEIIEMVTKRGEVITDDTNENTVYYLSK